METKEHSSMSAFPRRIVIAAPACAILIAKGARTDRRGLALLSDSLLKDLFKEASLDLADRVAFEAYVAKIRPSDLQSER